MRSEAGLPLLRNPDGNLNFEDGTGPTARRGMALLDFSVTRRDRSVASSVSACLQKLCLFYSQGKKIMREKEEEKAK